LLKLLALSLLVVDSSLSLPIEGSYAARTLNGHPLPAELRLAATAGDFRLFRLEQGVLRLSAGGRFTLYFRYYHQLVQRGGRPQSTPVLSDSETGTFEVERGRITFTPAKKHDGKAHPPMIATISGDEITASYVIESGRSQPRVTLTLRRDRSYW
jgi:hypothetical protein